MGQNRVGMKQLYKERGRTGRCKKRPVYAGGLYSRLQGTPVQQGEFSIKLLQSVFGDLFYRKPEVKHERPIRIQIWGYGKTQKAADRKSIKAYKKFQKQLMDKVTVNGDEMNTTNM